MDGKWLSGFLCHYCVRLSSQKLSLELTELTCHPQEGLPLELVPFRLGYPGNGQECGTCVGGVITHLPECGHVEDVLWRDVTFLCHLVSQCPQLIQTFLEIRINSCWLIRSVVYSIPLFALGCYASRAAQGNSLCLFQNLNERN